MGTVGYLRGVCTAGLDLPGVPKVSGGDLQLIVAAQEIVVDIAVEITTQTTHPVLHTHTHKYTQISLL